MTKLLFFDDFGEGLSIQRRFSFKRAKWRRLSGIWELNDRPSEKVLTTHHGETTRENESALISRTVVRPGYDLSVSIRFLTPSRRPPEGGILIYLRFVNRADHYAAHFCLSKQRVELWRRNRDGWCQIGPGFAFDFQVGPWYDVCLNDDGHKVICLVNGFPVLDDIDHWPSAGCFGLGAKYCDAAFGSVTVTLSEPTDFIPKELDNH